jgi:predicted TIM-barrel enzyme
MPQSSLLFDSTKPVIAMIHVGALPGTPASGLTLKAI